MKTKHMYQEILISTRTTFAHKALVEISEENGKTSPIEKFTEAVWNGLLNEMFAELMPPTSGKRRNMFIWQIYAGASYLLVSRADVPDMTESSLPIDPHLILVDTCKN